MDTVKHCDLDKFNTISVMYRPLDHFIVIKPLSVSFVLVLQNH